MPAGPIQYQDHLHLGAGTLADESQVMVHVLGIGQRSQQSRRVAGQRVDRTEQVHPFILCLLDGGRTRASGAPAARQGPLLSDAGLVLDPDFDPPVRMVLCRRLDKRGASSRHCCIWAGSFLG
jgi:hypothetical protein